MVSYWQAALSPTGVNGAGMVKRSWLSHLRESVERYNNKDITYGVVRVPWRTKFAQAVRLPASREFSDQSLVMTVLSGTAVLCLDGMPLPADPIDC